MTIAWPAKAPVEVVERQISWIGRLAGDEIATSVLTLLSGTVTLADITNTTDTVSVTLSGGTPCDGGEVFQNTITTLGGLTLQEIVTMQVVDSSLGRPITGPYDGPSTATKRTVIAMAFEEITLAGYEYDLTPEEMFSALRRLDALMAEWKAAGLDLGYNAPAVFGNGDLDDVLGIADTGINAVALYLALRIMPIIGKTMSAETRFAMVSGLNALRTGNAIIPERQLQGGTPRGAGNKWASRNQPLTFYPRRL